MCIVFSDPNGFVSVKALMPHCESYQPDRFYPYKKMKSGGEIVLSGGVGRDTWLVYCQVGNSSTVILRAWQAYKKEAQVYRISG